MNTVARMYERNRTIWVRAAASLCGMDGEDVVQDVMTYATYWRLPDDEGEANAVVLWWIRKRGLEWLRERNADKRAPELAVGNLHDMAMFAGVDPSPTPLDEAIGHEEEKWWAERLGRFPLALDGMTNEEQAEYLKVSRATLNRWKKYYRETGEWPE